jgi:hypothetical protein
MERRIFVRRITAGLAFSVAYSAPLMRRHEARGLLGAGAKRFHPPAGLKEEVWETSKSKDLLHRLLRDDRDFDVDRFTHAYALYIEGKGDPIVLTWFISTAELAPPTTAFVEFLARINPQTWKELLFACEVHDYCIHKWTDGFDYISLVEEDELLEDPVVNWPTFAPLPIVDLLLEDSRGALIWAHQMHSLYGLFDGKIDAAIAFRKNVNAGRADALEGAKSMTFPEGCSLADVIQERMIFGCTKNMELRKASILLPYLLTET